MQTLYNLGQGNSCLNVIYDEIESGKVKTLKKMSFVIEIQIIWRSLRYFEKIE